MCIWEPNTQNVRIAGTSRLGVLIILLFISASIAAGVTATTVAEANVRTVAQRTNGKLVRSGHSFTAWAMRKTGSQLSLEGGFKKNFRGGWLHGHASLFAKQGYSSQQRVESFS